MLSILGWVKGLFKRPVSKEHKDQRNSRFWDEWAGVTRCMICGRQRDENDNCVGTASGRLRFIEHGNNTKLIKPRAERVGAEGKDESVEAGQQDGRDIQTEGDQESDPPSV